jgi:hypothetical protein
MECYRSQLGDAEQARSGEFRMPAALVEHFASHPEIFFREL